MTNSNSLTGKAIGVARLGVCFVVPGASSRAEATPYIEELAVTAQKREQSLQFEFRSRVGAPGVLWGVRGVPDSRALVVL